ncbi:hypothetical protein [Bosea sp. (in: a-proteobacteria)]|uniref:hypothetical protein n=1 Tax=Bosea sp. (in: a-proteobacteria) TaxID=1871050 RepID=UPI002FC8703D
MLTRRFAIAACLGLATVPGALAQGFGAPPPEGAPPLPPAPVPLPERGMGYPPRGPLPPPRDDVYDYGIGEREAVRIARRRGLVDVERVRRGRNVWIVSGTDDYGEDLRIVIGDDGEVLDIRRD